MLSEGGCGVPSLMEALEARRAEVLGQAERLREQIAGLPRGVVAGRGTDGPVAGLGTAASSSTPSPAHCGSSATARVGSCRAEVDADERDDLLTTEEKDELAQLRRDL